MKNSGVSYFCDFRENGLQGINYLQKAFDRGHTTIVFDIIVIFPLDFNKLYLIYNN